MLEQKTFRFSALIVGAMAFSFAGTFSALADEAKKDSPAIVNVQTDKGDAGQKGAVTPIQKGEKQKPVDQKPGQAGQKGGQQEVKPEPKPVVTTKPEPKPIVTTKPVEQKPGQVGGQKGGMKPEPKPVVTNKPVDQKPGQKAGQAGKVEQKPGQKGGAAQKGGQKGGQAGQKAGGKAFLIR